MKGIIQKHGTGLGVRFTLITSEIYMSLTLPIHPYQSVEGLEVGSTVDFNIERFWETGIETGFDVAGWIEKKKKKQKKNKNGKGDIKI